MTHPEHHHFQQQRRSLALSTGRRRGPAGAQFVAAAMTTQTIELEVDHDVYHLMLENIRLGCSRV